MRHTFIFLISRGRLCQKCRIGRPIKWFTSKTMLWVPSGKWKEEKKKNGEERRWIIDASISVCVDCRKLTERTCRWIQGEDCGCQTDKQNLILKMSVWVFVCWKWSRLEPVISRWPRLGCRVRRETWPPAEKSLFCVSELARVGVRKWWRGERWFSQVSSGIFPYPARLYLSAIQPRLPISACGCVYSCEPAVNEMYPLFTGPLSR